MRGEGAGKNRSKESDEVIWVISDTHLGQDESNEKESRESRYGDFEEFLRYVSSKKEFTVKADGKNRKFKRPTKLILLGDIFELNDPKDDLYRSVTEHLFPSLNYMLNLSDEIWYIPGNHDDAIEKHSREGYLEEKYCQFISFFLNIIFAIPIIGISLADKFQKKYPDNYRREGEPYAEYYYLDYEKKKGETKPRFRIIPRLHKGERKYKYESDKDPRQSIVVGGKRYLFLHGHEFDKFQTFVGPLNRMPGIFQRLNQVKNAIGWPVSFSLIFFTWFIPFLVREAGPTISFNIPIIDYQISFVLGSFIFEIFNTLFLGAIGLFFISWFVVHAIHPLWQPINRYLKKISPISSSQRNKSLGEVILKSNFDPKRLGENIDVVVFGHTHMPELLLPDEIQKINKEETVLKNKTFINTGGWTLEGLRGQENKKEVNTFLVIDKNGPLLLRWEGDKKTPFTEWNDEYKKPFT